LSCRSIAKREKPPPEIPSRGNTPLVPKKSPSPLVGGCYYRSGGRGENPTLESRKEPAVARGGGGSRTASRGKRVADRGREHQKGSLRPRRKREEKRERGDPATCRQPRKVNPKSNLCPLGRGKHLTGVANPRIECGPKGEEGGGLDLQGGRTEKKGKRKKRERPTPPGHVPVFPHAREKKKGKGERVALPCPPAHRKKRETRGRDLTPSEKKKKKTVSLLMIKKNKEKDTRAGRAPGKKKKGRTYSSAACTKKGSMVV